MEFFALLGPSGSGKTTTLRVLAGLETPDAGTMTVDGVDVTFAQPGKRDVAMVFQNYALYPHMTLAANIGFPLKMDGVAKDKIPDMVREAAAKVKIDHLLHRRPGQLSGGQQQRCALARAIVRQPRLFLLDEPLSNLDAQLRLETRVELKKLQRELDVTTIYVTHDQEEAMTIADRIAVFLDGDIVQVGTPDEVFNRPRGIHVAAFIGSPPMNLFSGRLDGNSVWVGDYRVDLATAPEHPAGAVTVGVRPEPYPSRWGGPGGQTLSIGEPRRDHAAELPCGRSVGQGAASRGPVLPRERGHVPHVRTGPHPSFRSTNWAADRRLTNGWPAQVRPARQNAQKAVRKTGVGI